MRQSTLAEFKVALANYQAYYRHPDLEPWQVFGLYDLCPPGPPEGVIASWPAPWPGGNSAGVYVITDVDQKLVYIGKASMNSSIGNRLSTYFEFDENRGCRLKHPSSWKCEPRYLATVPMADELKFEAAGLEEYLIGVLHTTDNTAGVIRG